jgi:mRNA interferase MazF
MIRGEIWMVDFGIPFGSEPGWRRPSIVVQNDEFNQSAMHTTIVIPLTSNLRLADFPGNMLLPVAQTGLNKDSVAVTPQITVIDKARLSEKICDLSDEFMRQCDENIQLLLDL